MRFFLHYDDPVFEQFGGIYVPYATEAEARNQAAHDLLHAQGDATAIGLLGLFQAEYGGHEKLAPRVYDYNSPFGHLDKTERRKIATAKQLVRGAPKLQKAMLEAAQRGQDDHLLSMHRRVQEGSAFKAQQPGSAWRIVSGGTATGGAIALTAATAKTVIGIAAGSADQPLITEFEVSFDGVTATAVPVLVEACTGTNATNPPGTASTSMTPKQLRGWPAQTPQTTGAYNWTTEPTVLEVFRKLLLTPNGGLIVIQSPLGREPTGLITAATQGKFFGFRLTAPATVNVHAGLELEE